MNETYNPKSDEAPIPNNAENVSGVKGPILDSIRSEGEMVLYRLAERIDKLFLREKHPELLRKLLLEFERPIRSLDDYRSAKSQNEIIEKIVESLEIVYGSLSVGARKAIEMALKSVVRFSEQSSKWAAEAADTASDPEKFYKIDNR